MPRPRYAQEKRLRILAMVGCLMGFWLWGYLKQWREGKCTLAVKAGPNGDFLGKAEQANDLSEKTWAL